MTLALDPLDRDIIDCLLEDGRMTASDMARRLVGASERTVRYRVERLVAQGVVHVGAIVNPKALGYGVTADVWIEAAPDRLREVAARLADLEVVSYVAYSTGERDLSIQVYARDNEDLHEYVSDVIGRIPGVTRTSIMLVPWKVKDVHQWRVPRGAPANRRSTGEQTRRK